MKNIYGISSDKPLNPKLNCNLHTCVCRSSNFIWVSEKLNLVYFETPKCGCSSLKMAFDIGFGFTPLHFAMAHVIGSQRCFTNQSKNFTTNMNMPFCHSPDMTLDEFYEAIFLAVSNLRAGNYLSDPVGKFGFRHFFGTPSEAVNLFRGYKKFVVVRDPFDRLVSAWNMFYNASSYRRYRIMERVIQCIDAKSENCSFKFFLRNFIKYPNHHFESISRYVPVDFVLSGEVEAVSIEDLPSFWRDITAGGDPSLLGRENKALSYLEVDVSKSDVLKDEGFSSYYADDFKMLNCSKGSAYEPGFF